MLKSFVLAIPIAILAQGAFAASTATGHAGLALAAVVAIYSPALNAPDKLTMERLFDGRQDFPLPAGQTIKIVADKIVCKAGNVAITAQSCALSFGAKTVNIEGRRANELFATMVEADVPSDGALGTIYEGLTGLACTIDPNEIKQNAGGGASCAYTVGQ
jgi:hypothetical protein